jgi:hypothetical protein
VRLAHHILAPTLSSPTSLSSRRSLSPFPLCDSLPRAPPSVLSSSTSRGASFFLTHFPWRHLLQHHRARPLLSWPSLRPLHRAAHPRQGLSTSAPDRRQTTAVTASRGPPRPLHMPTHPRWSLSSSGHGRRWMLGVAASGGRCSSSVVGPSCAAPPFSLSLSIYLLGA